MGRETHEYFSEGGVIGRFSGKNPGASAKFIRPYLILLNVSRYFIGGMCASSRGVTVRRKIVSTINLFPGVKMKGYVTTPVDCVRVQFIKGSEMHKSVAQAYVVTRSPLHAELDEIEVCMQSSEFEDSRKFISRKAGESVRIVVIVDNAPFSRVNPNPGGN